MTATVPTTSAPTAASAAPVTATATAPAALPLTPPANLRDLAGITIPGGTTRAGFAWRADDLSTIDEASAERLVADGLSTVIDLRSAAELDITGRGLLGTLPVNYHHVPFMTSINAAVEHTDPSDMWDQSRFADMYISMFENAAPQIVTAMAVIAHAPGTPVFHCAAGQDRTGVLAASLLLAVGAGSSDIVDDYARTGENIAAVAVRVRPVIEPMMARFGMQLNAAARAAVRTEYSRAPMLGLLDHLHATYARPLQPLYDAGLTTDLVETLRRRALSA